MILSFKLLINSWGHFYNKFLKLDFEFCFTFGESVIEGYL